MTFPTSTRFLVIGAGVHGLSTAFHLARKLKAAKLGDGRDIIVVDKAKIGAGASGIACGVVRNNYFQPAMRELMAHSVAVWESDPEAYSYHPVGYMQISPESMHEDVAGIHAQQKAIGYDSVFVEGKAESRRYMIDLLEDWRAEGITSVLHEKRGGYANNMASLRGLAGKAEAEGVRILGDVTVIGFVDQTAGGAIAAVETDRGRISCEQVIIGIGPWIPKLWRALDLPETLTVRDGEGVDHPDVSMWTYWCLQEGTLGVDPATHKTRAGDMPPVIHVDSDAPLYSDVDGSLITDRMWGIYYKPDFHFGGIQGGTMPYRVEGSPYAVAVDPYGPESPDFVVDDRFAQMWCSALAHCQKRFAGRIDAYRKEPSGGLGAFTPDSFPVIDVFRENVHIIADSNHGYKMIGVGELVAEEVMGGKSSLLEPFRFTRYAEGKLHPVSHSPFPWS